MYSIFSKENEENIQAHFAAQSQEQYETKSLTGIVENIYNALVPKEHRKSFVGLMDSCDMEISEMVQIHFCIHNMTKTGFAIVSSNHICESQEIDADFLLYMINEFEMPE